MFLCARVSERIYGKQSANHRNVYKSETNERKIYGGIRFPLSMQEFEYVCEWVNEATPQHLNSMYVCVFCVCATTTAITTKTIRKSEKMDGKEEKNTYRKITNNNINNKDSDGNGNDSGSGSGGGKLTTKIIADFLFLFFNLHRFVLSIESNKS